MTIPSYSDMQDAADWMKYGLVSLCDLTGVEMDYQIIDNTLFTLNPYAECYCNIEAGHCKADDPQFVYKPLGLEVRWYKHCGRSMKANKELSLREFYYIIAACISYYLAMTEV